MKSLLQHRSHLLASAILVLLTFPAHADNCDNLAKLHLTHATITKAETISEGTFAASGGKLISDLPIFCRVAATVRPVEDSNILVEIWMPQTGWNGRIEGTGTGGLAGWIDYGALAAGVRRGYAVTNTDMGMGTPSGKDAGIFVNHRERWIDWGYRATHEMTVLAKQVSTAFYTRKADKAYFVGCSTGGEQALMEAQRFPDDYDGVVAGAPANNRTGVHVSILWNFVVPQITQASHLPPAKIAMLSKAVIQACDALDGVTDGVIADPRKCNFDPGGLECKSASQKDCLTTAQVQTVRSIYSGPVNPRTGQSLYPGLEKGSEGKWDSLAPEPGGAARAPFAPVFEWVFGLEWSWKHFDFDYDVAALQQGLADVVNATNPDIDTFRAHGHKLLAYHGWNDPLVAPGESINYYNSVVARDEELDSRDQRVGATVEPSRHASLGPVDRSYRLFMVPGMEHCGGGPGPGNFDALDVIAKWVEQGAAPDKIIVSKTVRVDGGYSMEQQRLLCPYPRYAKYQSRDDPNYASSYTCAEPSLVPAR